MRSDSDVTRKVMLSIIASIYDPLGLLGPMIVLGKVLFQEATRRKLAWDEILPPDLLERWLYWLDSMKDIGKLRVPRCIKPTAFNDASLEIHHFSDASETAYGVCTYLRCVNKQGEISTILAISKSKVAPIKSITLPRLELQAAVMAVQVDGLLRKQLDLSFLSSYFWVDSEIVLKYIANDDKRFHVFVANRLSIIHQLSSPDQWRHVSVDINPADLVTRGKSIASMNMNTWLYGPSFLKQYKSDWEVQDVDVSLSESDPEIKQEVRTCVANASAVSATDYLLAYFSDWYKLKRSVAWLLRFKMYLKMHQAHNSVDSRHLTVSELKQAEIAILQYVQGCAYEKETQALSKGKDGEKNSPIKHLSPVLGPDGLLRVGGRLKQCDIESICTQPIIVPHIHPVAKCIAHYFHNIGHLQNGWSLQ